MWGDENHQKYGPGTGADWALFRDSDDRSWRGKNPGYNSDNLRIRTLRKGLELGSLEGWLRSDLDDGYTLGEQFVDDRDVVVGEADAAHGLVASDGIGINGAVDAVACE